MTAPWFSAFNYKLFRILFGLLPHSAAVDSFFDTLISTPLLSTWIFAACFFRLWTQEDERKARRQKYLVCSVVAFGMAVLITVIVRPWISWPAPVLNPAFQSLFPRYLWGNGSRNCFPSHSTLAYFMMALGMWPLNRQLSLGLAGMTIFFISLPRVYVGGHYPIDVLFSCVLGTLVLIAVWRWRRPSSDSIRPAALTQKTGGLHRDIVFFLWIFELGEGFRSAESLAHVARRLILKI